MTNKFFIHATNVHQGGGRALLDALLRVLSELPAAVALLDSRMPLADLMSKSVQILRVQPSLSGRLKAEWWLVNNVSSEDIVLCFGNLPPLFKLRGRTVVFLQNRYLVDGGPLLGFPVKIRIRLAIERLWLSLRKGNADEFVVQTQTMRRLLERRVSEQTPVRILPFIGESAGYKRSLLPSEANVRKEIVLLYVASGEPHKNHRRLIKAWQYLAAENLFPTLHLTLDENEYSNLCAWIWEMKQRHALKIVNLGSLPHEALLDVYKKVDALIYPSIFESFGLPLIEVRRVSLPILAAELDYVRDVLDPEQTFDPESPLSIARAVKRFMGVDEHPLPLLDAKSFIENLIGNAE